MDKSTRCLSGAILMISLASLMTGCATGDRVDNANARAEKIAPGPAKAIRRDLVGYATFPGNLYVPPASQADVHPPYNAPLEQVYVTVGKRVRRGEVLMKLSIPEADSNYSDAYRTVQEAEAAYATARTQNGEQVRQAKDQLDQARKVERQWRDAAKTSGDATELNQAIEARKQAEQVLRDAQATFDQNMRPYQTQLDQARGSRRTAKADVKQSEVKAPISGTVLTVNAQPGQTIGNDAGETLVKIVDLDEIKVRTDLSATEFGKLKERSPVVIRFADFPDKPFDGWVVSLRTLPQSAGGLKHEALIGFRNDEGVVKPGAIVDSVGIETGRAKDVICVPVDAVDRDDQDRPVVQVLEGENWVPHVVETGLSDGTYVEVKSGVKEGETVRVTTETKVSGPKPS